MARVRYIYIFVLKKLKKVEKIGYHSNFNFECNTESASKESLSIALGLFCSFDQDGIIIKMSPTIWPPLIFAG